MGGVLISIRIMFWTTTVLAMVVYLYMFVREEIDVLKRPEIKPFVFMGNVS